MGMRMKADCNLGKIVEKIWGVMWKLVGDVWKVVVKIWGGMVGSGTRRRGEERRLKGLRWEKGKEGKRKGGGEDGGW